MPPPRGAEDKLALTSYHRLRQSRNPDLSFQCLYLPSAASSLPYALLTAHYAFRFTLIGPILRAGDRARGHRPGRPAADGPNSSRNLKLVIQIAQPLSKKVDLRFGVVPFRDWHESCAVDKVTWDGLDFL